VIHLRLIIPTDLAPSVIEMLKESPEVTNVWHMPGVASKPEGDVVSCDVAKEEGTSILRELRELGLEKSGSIAMESVDASISNVARDAERAAPGLPVDAVIWEEVESRVFESASISVSYLLFITIATMIGAIGIITDSVFLVIGAMVVGPEYGPLAGICVALIERRPRIALISLKALLIGFSLGIVAAAVLTVVLKVTGVAPDALLGDASNRQLTLFISHPNWYSAIVAVLAGIVGMLALASAKSGALIGVLISVTTIPAAANVGVAASYGEWNEAWGAAAQLAINVVAILGSGLAVLWVAKRVRQRRMERRAGNPVR
jgi:uncharacterized hydrophobic protein (TIGR00271 family)